MKFKLLSLLLVLAGLFLLGSSIWPIVEYELFSLTLAKPDLLSPVSSYPDPLPANEGPFPLILTNANSWFIGDAKLPEVVSKVHYYNISVPKLGVEGAVVEIGGDDLAKNLIHYKGTALPGRVGNTVIFGHSSLPQFFSSRNYLTIFTKLPTLAQGDKIYLDYDGIKYTYTVEELFEVRPTDIGILAQRFDNSFLTLVTCVPPGTLFKRLIVRARLTPTSG